MKFCLNDIKKIMLSTFGHVDKNINKDSDLANDLGIDELQKIELCIAIEEEHNVYIDSEDWKKVETINDVINLLGKK